MDKVAALFFLLWPNALPELPVYKPNEHVEEAWKNLIDALTNHWKWEVTLYVSQPFDQLFPTWDGLRSRVIEDRKDMHSPLRSAEPLVGSLGIPCRFTLSQRMYTPLSESGERRSNLGNGQLDQYHLCQLAISAPGTQPEVTLAFAVWGTGIDMDPATTDSNPNELYYIVPQLGSTAGRARPANPGRHSRAVSTGDAEAVWKQKSLLVNILA